MKAGRLITLRRDAYAGHTALAPASEQIWIAEIRFRQRNLVTKQSFVTSQEEINPKTKAFAYLTNTPKSQKHTHKRIMDAAPKACATAARSAWVHVFGKKEKPSNRTACCPQH